MVPFLLPAVHPQICQELAQAPVFSRLSAMHTQSIARAMPLPFTLHPGIEKGQKLLIDDPASGHHGASNDTTNTTSTNTDGASPSSHHDEGLTQKVAGEVLVVNKHLGLGLAMMRLDTLYTARQNGGTNPPEHSGEGMKGRFVAAGSSIEVMPFRPAWWPELDQSTGKPIE